MSDMKTTGVFAAVAAVSLGLAYAFRPTTIRSELDISEDRKGQPVFVDFNPDVASSFRIVKFNEELASISQLELAKDVKTEVWTLPSSDGYPADSAEQVSQAIAPLTDLIVLSTVSTDRGDHAMYGVVEPKEDQLDVSTTGVGTLLRVGGSNGEVLADLIVGKAVKDTEDQHYVRRPAEDAVYVVQIKTDAYSTQFEKWIKGEILNVRSMDIEYAGLRDYAILPLESGGYGLGRNFDADVQFKDNKWSLQKFVDYKQEGDPVSTEPPAGQSLADTALNDLKNSVQNLKIVNVRRKPAGLAAELKADESLMNNKESVKSLQNQGFFPMESGEVFATGGELIVGTKDGVQYLLRFGNTSVSGSALEADQKEGEEDAVRRYMLVTAKLDESKFPPPELKVVPETVEEMLAVEAEEAAKSNPAPASPTGEAPAADAAPSAEATATEPASAAMPADKPAEPNADTPAQAKEPETTEPKSAEPAEEPVKVEPATEETKSEAPAAEPTEPADQPAAADQSRAGSQRGTKLVAFQPATQEGDAKPADDPAPATPPAAPAGEEQPAAEAPAAAAPAEGKTELAPSRQESPEELKERLQFLQETIKKENQRLIDARNESMKQASKKVKELNASFADWYYLISDSAYTKLRLSREQLFKSATAQPDAAAAPGGLPQFPALPPQ